MPRTLPTHRWSAARPAVAALLLAAACTRPPAAAPPTPAPSPALTGEPRVAVGASRMVVARGAEALARFAPARPAVEEGGECSVFAMAPIAGARHVSERHQDRDGVGMVVTVTVDSVGRMLRSSEQRGVVAVTAPPGPGPVSDPRALLAAAGRRVRSTNIHLDYVTGRAILSNSGGGEPDEGVMARVEEVAELERLGRPGARARAVLARCGGAERHVARTSSDSLPYEFVHALFGAGFQGAVRMRAGEAADGVPLEALPRGSEVVGSVVYPSSSRTAVLVPGTAGEVVSAFRDRLGVAGWTKPSAPDGPTMRGFMRSAAAPREPNGLCRGDAYLVPTVTGWPDGRTLLRVSISTGQNSGCPVEQRWGGAITVAPLLAPPPLTAMDVSGAGVGRGSWWSMVSGHSTLPLPRLLAHYGDQMRSAGWEPAGEEIGAAVGTIFHRRQPDDGTLWHSLLTIADRPGGGFVALLRVERDAREERR